MVHIFWIVWRMRLTVKCKKCEIIRGILIPINLSRWPDFQSKCLISSSFLSTGLGGVCRPSAHISRLSSPLFSIMGRMSWQLAWWEGGSPKARWLGYSPSSRKSSRLRGGLWHLVCGEDMMTLLFFCHH